MKLRKSAAMAGAALVALAAAYAAPALAVCNECGTVVRLSVKNAERNWS